MDYYFDRYKFFEEGRVWFARRKLEGPDRIYWDTIERDCVDVEFLIETWDEMKDKLKEKYFLELYRYRLLDELHRLRQGSMSV